MLSRCPLPGSASVRRRSGSRPLCAGCCCGRSVRWARRRPYGRRVRPARCWRSAGASSCRRGLPPARAGGFARDQARVLAGGMRLMALGERVTATARALGLPLVFLKFAGLELGGRLAPGSRAACDLDVLAPPERAGELQHALAAGGLRPSRLPAPEHQLPPLAGPAGVVEVHRVLLGVRVAGAGSATLADLARAGLLVPVEQFSGAAAAIAPASRRAPVRGTGRRAAPAEAEGYAILDPAAAVAHTLVHGIAQHGWSPLAYGLLKMVGDLIDLGFGDKRGGDGGGGGDAGDALAERVAPWVAGDLGAGELAAARGLCAALAAGDDLAGWDDSPAEEALLLRHALAGRLDPRYERALKLGLFRRQPSDHPETGRLARSLLATVWLSDAQIDAI